MENTQKQIGIVDQFCEDESSTIEHYRTEPWAGASPVLCIRILFTTGALLPRQVLVRARVMDQIGYGEEHGARAKDQLRHAIGVVFWVVFIFYY